MDFGFSPDEGRSVFIVAVDKGIDVLAQLFDRGEGGAAQRLSLQDGEPNLDLVEPGSPRWSEVKVDVLVTRQPTINLRLMGAEIVEDDMDDRVGVRIGGDDLVHERKEFDAPATLLVCHRDLAAGDLQSGKQGRGGRSTSGHWGVSNSPGPAPRPGSRASRRRR